jgi:multidrug efflux pump subunit AcrB
MEKTLKTLPIVSKVSRSGLLDERIFLYYSQERLASYGIQTSKLPDILSARNITLPGGQLEAGGKNLSVDPTGEFKSEKEIGDVVVSTSTNGSPIYLRDLADVMRSYNNPPRYLNYYNWRDAKGEWHRTRAITLAAQMRSGEQIAKFGKAVDDALGDLKKRLPEDLVMARTSDQPLQVQENISLFMNSLYEALILVVIVSLIGFWEWRSALLMALSIPITLLMTFGMMDMLGIDLQQVSVASLIIALGLLVDDPVVAGDAIKRELGARHPSIISAWLGPTKLATAIMYATVTNIVAYLPFLLLSGATSEFIYSLPVVLACSLVASRLVSMSFIPLLGYYLLRAKTEVSAREYGEEHKSGDALQSLTTFIGGGGPRFWFSAAPELQQLNYAQTIIQVKDKHDTNHLIEPLQKALSAEVVGARVDVRQLESGKAVGLPVQIRISGDDAARSVVLLISVIAIFLALVFQFKHAIKPLIVFAAIPYGMVGALISLWVMGSPFGFMAFLGCVSLVGVIVSHVIVLFDFIDEAHERGESLREALLDAGIMRLRPVLITVGATVFALFPLASHGGPLWEPMCYAQIGGLSVATFVTLLLVPVLYAIFVLDLKLVKWETVGSHSDEHIKNDPADQPTSRKDDVWKPQIEVKSLKSR